jgi:hypothetical protein
MGYKRQLILAWLSFPGILSGEIILDYSMRIQSDDFYTGGISEPMWFSIQIIAALSGIYFLFKGNKFLNTIKAKSVSLILNLLLGCFFYLALIYSYVLGLGIDSF